MADPVLPASATPSHNHLTTLPFCSHCFSDSITSLKIFRQKFLFFWLQTATHGTHVSSAVLPGQNTATPASDKASTHGIPASCQKTMATLCGKTGISERQFWKGLAAVWYCGGDDPAIMCCEMCRFTNHIQPFSRVVQKRESDGRVLSTTTAVTRTSQRILCALLTCPHVACLKSYLHYNHVLIECE